ncbi:MAG: NAD(P)-dependent alcohol dehydrogenase [Pirellulales bacterium]
MRQWVLGEQPGHDQLRLDEIRPPELGPRQVRVRMRAASINYRDTVVVTAADRFTPGRVPLSDGAGEVVELGAEVTRWQVGDRVIGTFFRDWTCGRFDMRYHAAALGGSVDGVLRDSADFPEHALVSMPRDYSFEEAATLPCAGLTAWYSLHTRGEFQPGDSVLLLGTGGVSVWGLQIVHACGGRAIITSSSDEKLAKAIALGAAHAINYRSNPDWEKEVLAITNRTGVDHVLEVGGPGTLGKSMAAVRAGGHIALIGILTGFAAPDASVFPLTSKNATMSGIYVGHREALEQFVCFLDQTKIRPVIDTVVPFEQAPDAYRLMKSGKHFGKIVIKFD